jgi:hypothetical protein
MNYTTIRSTGRGIKFSAYKRLKANEMAELAIGMVGLVAGAGLTMIGVGIVLASIKLIIK